jgi:hypothetical protein
MKSFENLIVKYINQDASVKELEQLLSMLKSKDNIVLFRSYVKINFYSIYLMNDIDNIDIINKIKEKIELEKKNQKSRNRSLLFLKYAAIFILLIGVGYYLRFLELENINSKDVIPKKDDITITTPSGRQLIINELNETTIDKDINLIKSSNELIYSQNNKLENLTHRINVPYGKKINIVLSDGTKVYLNSGSNLIYPISFKKNEARIVELIGEAYFDVAPKSNAFKVKSNDINIEVYGTEFNFKNFPEDDISDVVLVEGSVGIVLESSNKSIQLLPGQLGKVFKENLDIQTERINTKIYTSWINGEVVFRNEKFSQILLKLERLYNVTIINNKKDNDDLFNASIDLDNESNEEVLSYFKEIYNIEYQIFNNKIIIK